MIIRIHWWVALHTRHHVDGRKRCAKLAWIFTVAIHIPRTRRSGLRIFSFPAISLDVERRGMQEEHGAMVGASKPNLLAPNQVVSMLLVHAMLGNHYRRKSRLIAGLAKKSTTTFGGGSVKMMSKASISEFRSSFCFKSTVCPTGSSPERKENIPES